MDITRTRLDRIVELDRQIRAKKYPNCTSFARHWMELIGSGEMVDRKTVFRDIEWLRNTQHAPIEWSPIDKGYYYSEPTWAMPLLRLTDGELVSLLLARQMSAMYKNTPIAGSIEELFKKIARTLSEPVDVDPVVFGNQLSFHSHPSRPIDSAIWKTLFQALRENRVVRLVYKRLGEGAGDEREVEPAHLANVDDDWYLAAFCRNRDDWRNFSVSRIDKVKLTNKPFVPRDFDPERHFAQRFGKYIAPPGEEAFNVVLRFAPSAYPVLLERTWHQNQSLKVNKDKSAILTLPIPSLIEAKRFVLGWGAEVEVLEPEALRDMITAEVRQLAQCYAGVEEAKAPKRRR